MVVGGISRFIEEFEGRKSDCLLTLAAVKDPERFGVPELKDGKIIHVEEKPKSPKSGYAIAGIYVYNHTIFGAVKSLKPSSRGELEISDAHQYLIDHKCHDYCEITSWWKDTGKPEDLLEANRLVLEHQEPRMEGVVDSSSSLSGMVIVERGARVVNSKRQGPVIIGRDCLVKDSTIGPCTSLGDRTEVRSSEIEYSIVLERCKIHDVRGKMVGSILGYDVEVFETGTQPRAHRFIIGDQSRAEVS